MKLGLIEIEDIYSEVLQLSCEIRDLQTEINSHCEKLKDVEINDENKDLISAIMTYKEDY